MGSSDHIEEVDISGTTEGAPHRPLKPILIGVEDESRVFVAYVEEVFEDESESETSLDTMEILFPEPGCDLLDFNPPPSSLTCRCSSEIDKDSESTGNTSNENFNQRPSNDYTPPVDRTSEIGNTSKNGQKTSSSFQSMDGSCADHADHSRSYPSLRRCISQHKCRQSVTESTPTSKLKEDCQTGRERPITRKRSLRDFFHQSRRATNRSSHRTGRFGIHSDSGKSLTRMIQSACGKIKLRPLFNVNRVSNRFFVCTMRREKAQRRGTASHRSRNNHNESL